VHYQHGVGHYEGMVKRTIGGIERDYLLLGYKGGDKLYVPSDQIDSLRQYVGGETPTLHRLGGADFAKAKSRCAQRGARDRPGTGRAVPEAGQRAGHSFGSDTPWQPRWRTGFPFVETPIKRSPIDDVKVDMERPYPMDRSAVRRRRLRQDRGRDPRGVQGHPGQQAGGRAGPTTLLVTQHGNTFADPLRGYPIRVETLSRFLTNKEAKPVIEGLASWRGRLRHRHPTGSCKRASSSKISGC
jgi:transcription-repair coupling factor (superfamily II helicase)